MKREKFCIQRNKISHFISQNQYQAPHHAINIAQHLFICRLHCTMSKYKTWNLTCKHIETIINLKVSQFSTEMEFQNINEISSTKPIYYFRWKQIAAFWRDECKINISSHYHRRLFAFVPCAFQTRHSRWFGLFFELSCFVRDTAHTIIYGGVSLIRLDFVSDSVSLCPLVRNMLIKSGKTSTCGIC